MDPTIQPIIVYSNQATKLGHINRYYPPLRILDRGTDIPISGRNIDNPTRVNQQGPIETNIPDTNSASNFDVFDYVRRTLYLAYRIVVE